MVEGEVMAGSYNIVYWGYVGKEILLGFFGFKICVMKIRFLSVSGVGLI